MAVALDTQWIKNFVECSICLEKFDNPKMLKCSHMFCKECLEDIIEFMADGSAAITCPMRCAAQTLISVDETINDLSTSYEFKGILDALKERDNVDYEIPLCSYDEKCGKDISMHCCESMMCSRCFADHDKSIDNYEHEGRTSLVFNKREGKLNVLCNKHACQCTYLCIDNTFLCSYCLKRNKEHEAHVKNTVERDVELIKEALLNDAKKKEKVQGFILSTENNIAHMKKKLDDLLQIRTQECLSHYNAFLKSEEERLKNHLESICNNHLKQYPVDPGYNCRLLAKSDVELAIQKETILETILKHQNKQSLNCESVSLSDSYNFQSEHPLGELHLTVGEEVLVNNSPVSTLTDSMTSPYGIGGIGNMPQLLEASNFSSHVLQFGNNSRNLTTDIRCHDNLLGQQLLAGGSLKEVVETGDMNNTYGTTQINITSQEMVDSKSEIINNPTTDMVQAYFDIRIDDAPVGWIVMDLFFGIVPKTCMNFVELCTHAHGYGYKGSKIHNISRLTGNCIGGDITKGDGSGGRSIYGDKFPCENFVKKHDVKGILSMRNIGMEGFTNSQFFIYSKARPEHDNRNVVFAKVTDETYHVFEKVMAVETKAYKPLKDIVILNCGVL